MKKQILNRRKTSLTGYFMQLLVAAAVASTVPNVSAQPAVSARKISVILNTKQIKTGLSLWKNNAESECVPSERAGRVCWEAVKQIQPGVYLMYWPVISPAFKVGRMTNATITVEYFDEGNGDCQVLYDSSDPKVLVVATTPGAWKEAGTIKYTGTKTWKTFSCTVGDALFSGRCNGADLRFNITSGDVRPAFASMKIAGVGALAATTAAAVSLDPIFTDDMVLQRDEKVRIYGSGITEGETVTVAFGGQTKTTTVNKGEWEVWLDPMPANSQGQTLTIKTKQDTVTRTNILVGDVWLLGGQSNMMAGFNYIPALLPAIHVANQPLIRMAYVDWPAESPQQSGDAQAILETPTLRHSKWSPCVYPGASAQAQALLDEFSPGGYFFATNLVAHTGVPVGLVMACLGGTKAQWWMPMSEIQQHAELECYLDDGDPNTSYLYDSVIHPIRKFTVRGVLWYQGETDNPLPEEYGLIFPRLIQSWRQVFGKEMPFIFASISSFEWPSDSWAYLRESQAKGLSQPRTGMIMTYDIGDFADIHPVNKWDVGYRFFMKARAVAYGEKIVSSGPVFAAVKMDGGKAVVAFGNVGSGLVTRAVSMPKNLAKTEFYTANSNTLVGFTMCGPDRVFHPATAVISGANTVVVECSTVPHPVAVRYAWATFTLANLFNRDGFPAEPFRTDTFPVPRFTPLAATGATVSGDDPAWGKAMTICEKDPETSVASVKRGWRNGWQLDDAKYSMMYFSAPDALAQGRSPRVRLTVVYFDEGRGSFSFCYDSSDAAVRVAPENPGAWKDAGRIKLTNTKTWKAFTVEITDAKFAKRCNGHDLRINGVSKDLVIGGVFVTAAE